MTQPARGADLPNPPSGLIDISGSATDDSSVHRVLVAVEDRTSTRWWNATTATWDVPFTQNDARMVLLFGDQAAAAMEAAHLYSGLEAQVERLRALTRLTQVISLTRDRSEVLR